MNPKTKTRTLNGIFLLSLAGFFISLYQTYHFFQVRFGLAGFESFCDIGATFNCTAIEMSSYAEFIWGIPLAALAAGWLLAQAIVALLAKSEEWKREGARVLVLQTAVGFGFSIFYLWVMSAKLGTYCLLCLGLDAVNFIALGLALTLKPEGLSVKPDLSKWGVAAGVILGSLALCGIVSQMMKPGQISQRTVNRILKKTFQTKPIYVNTDAALPGLGEKNAPVVIVKFSDFQCPSCRKGAESIHTVLKKYEGQVRFVFKHFPLDPRCNSSMQSGGHAYACEAAKAAHCAYEQGKFEGVYQALFESQPMIGEGKLDKILEKTAKAKVPDLDLETLRSCMKSERADLAVKKDIEEALALGVESTPTFFINGRRVLGALPPVLWSEIIDRLLKR